MPKGAAIGIRVAAEIKAALERAAVEDHRTISGYVEKLLAEHLTDKGYLKKPKR